MINVRQAISWWQRAQAGTLPTAVTGGRPLFAARCHYCSFVDKDAEKVFAHLRTHSENERAA